MYLHHNRNMQVWMHVVCRVLKNIFYLKSFQYIMCSFNVQIISGMGQEIDYMQFIVTLKISNYLLPHFNKNYVSLNRKTHITMQCMHIQTAPAKEEWCKQEASIC